MQGNNFERLQIGNNLHRTSTPYQMVDGKVRRVRGQNDWCVPPAWDKCHHSLWQKWHWHAPGTWMEGGCCSLWKWRLAGGDSKGIGRSTPSLSLSIYLPLFLSHLSVLSPHIHARLFPLTVFSLPEVRLYLPITFFFTPVILISPCLSLTSVCPSVPFLFPSHPFFFPLPDSFTSARFPSSLSLPFSLPHVPLLSLLLYVYVLIYLCIFSSICICLSLSVYLSVFSSA